MSGTEATALRPSHQHFISISNFAWGAAMSFRSALGRTILSLSCSAGFFLPALAQDQAATVLQPVVIQGDGGAHSSGIFEEEGYVAKAGRAAGKSDTPLIETPQSVSVITADQIDAKVPKL
ncbi:hypothetical protein AJ87_45220 [Rhizobium yanglingense]|nr:hypothetical protein AJ87_45220 [Rhizobium yanglingense]